LPCVCCPEPRGFQGTFLGSLDSHFELVKQAEQGDYDQLGRVQPEVTPLNFFISLH
jgi:hypothetical protein